MARTSTPTPTPAPAPITAPNGSGVVITLAGQPYPIGQLNLGQLRDLDIGVSLPPSPDKQEDIRRNYERSTNVLLTALRNIQPAITLEALEQMPISREELRDAFDAILIYAGLLKPADLEALKAGAASGETPAAGA